MICRCHVPPCVVGPGLLSPPLERPAAKFACSSGAQCGAECETHKTAGSNDCGGEDERLQGALAVHAAGKTK